MKKDKIAGWIIIIGIIFLVLLLGFSGINFMELMIKINKWFYSKLGEIGIYLATFGISIFGNFSIILPVPYLLSLVSLLLTINVNPILLALSAAFGASIGELSAWLLGRGTAEVFNKESYQKKIKGLIELIHKGLAFPLIILFAATPLPDDILLIALGMEKYSIKKSLVASFIGKLILILGITLGIIILKGTYLGNLVLYLFGLKIKNGIAESAGDPLISAITLVITIMITLIIIMVDWKKLSKKIRGVFNGRH